MPFELLKLPKINNLSFFLIRFTTHLYSPEHFLPLIITIDLN